MCDFHHTHYCQLCSRTARNVLAIDFTRDASRKFTPQSVSWKRRREWPAERLLSGAHSRDCAERPPPGDTRRNLRSLTLIQRTWPISTPSLFQQNEPNLYNTEIINFASSHNLIKHEAADMFQRIQNRLRVCEDPCSRKKFRSSVAVVWCDVDDLSKVI